MKNDKNKQEEQGEIVEEQSSGEVDSVDEEKPEEEILEDLEKETESSFAKATADKEVVDDDKKQVEYLKDQLARAVAETRNVEKRFFDEKQEFVKYANRDLLLQLLPAFDLLFLAGKYVEDEGVKLTIKRIEDVFAEIGVKKVETEGKKFDANVMECVETKEGDDGIVLKEIKPGFTLYGKLLTPATVVVGAGKNSEEIVN